MKTKLISFKYVRLYLDMHLDKEGVWFVPFPYMGIGFNKFDSNKNIHIVIAFLFFSIGIFFIKEKIRYL